MGAFPLNRKSVFVTLLLSFLAVLLIPISIGGLFYSRFESILVSHASRSNMALLDQVREAVDGQMAEVDRIRIKTSMDTDLQWLLTFGGAETPESQQKMIRLMNRLAEISNPSGFIESFYLYFRDSGTILTKSMKTDSQLFFTHLLPYRDLPADSAVKRIQAYSPGVYHASETIVDGAQEKQVITFIQSLPVEEKKSPEGTLVLLISESYIQRMLRNIEWVNRGQILILDEKGEPILRTADSGGFDYAAAADKLAGSSGQFSSGSDSDKQIVSYTKSSLNGWTFLSVVPERVVMAEVYRNKDLALILLGCGLFIGILLAYWLSYRNYTPVRRVIGDIVQRKNVTGPATNEYEWIRQTLLSSLDEGEELRESVTREMPVMRANFLSRLVRGYVQPNSISKETLDFMGLDFRHPYFGVALIRFGSEPGLGNGNGGGYSEQEWGLTGFIISNISGDLFQGRGWVVELERDQAAVLFNAEQYGDDFLEGVRRTSQELIRIANERFKTQVTVGIGELHEGVGNVGQSCREAAAALDYRMVRGVNSVIAYREVAGWERQYYHYPVELEIRLLNFGKSGDIRNVKVALQEIFDANFKINTLRPELGKCLFYDIVSTLYKLIDSLHLDQEELFGSGFEPLRTVEQCSTAEEMLEKFTELFEHVCRYVNEVQTDRGDYLYNRIREYIDGRFGDSMLSLTTLSDEFGMNGKYLSAFFKKYSGQNLTDYIQAVRVQHAKKLLADTGLTLEQIAQQVGYANDVGLIRVFKKQEGITPGKYREQLTRFS